MVAVSRTAVSFPEPANDAGAIEPELADAGAATVAASLLDRYEPDAVILVAGASPHMRPLQQQTWETFSVNWQTDVRVTFHWLREALPTAAARKQGGRVQQRRRVERVTAQRGLRRRQGYSALHHGLRPGRGAAGRPGHCLRAVLPYFADDRRRPAGGPGYAARAGLSVEEYLERQGSLVTPEIAGAALLQVADGADIASSYRLTGAGLQD